MKKKFLATLVLSASLGLVACGGTIEAESITLNAEKDVLQVGETIEVSVDIAPSDASDTFYTLTSADPSTLKVVDATHLEALKATSSVAVEASLGDLTSFKTFTIYDIATSLEISLDSYVLSVGETTGVNVAILPEGSRQDYTLTSSDPDYVEVVNSARIKALQETNGETVTITATAENGVSNSVEVEVKKLSEIANDELTELLNTSSEKEVKGVKAADFKLKSIDPADESIITNQDYQFDLYSDNKTKASYYQNLKEDIDEDALQEIVTKQEYDDKLYSIAYYSSGYVNSYSSRTVALDSDTLTDIGTDLNLATSLPAIYIGNSYSSSTEAVYGLSNYVLQEILKDTSRFAVDAAVEYSSNGSTYTLSIPKQTIKEVTYEDTLSLTFTDEILTSFTDTYKAYDGDSVVSEITTTATQEVGDRETAPEDFKSVDEYVYTELEVGLATSSYSYSASTAFYVGDKAYPIIVSSTPSKYSIISKFDGVDIVSVSDPDCATISTDYNGTYLSFIGENSALEVVTKSRAKGIENIITLSVTKKVPTSISFSTSRTDGYLYSKQLVGKESTFKVTSQPSGTTPVVTASIDKASNTALATLAAKDGTTNSFTLDSTNVGEATITAYDATLGENKAISKTVSFLEDSADTYLSEFKAIATDYVAPSSLKSIAVTTDESDANKGTLTITPNVYGSSEVYTADWAFSSEDKSITLSNIVLPEDPTYTIESVAFADGINKIDINYVWEDRDGYTTEDTFVYNLI
jgi:hypothetical protein